MVLGGAGEPRPAPARCGPEPEERPGTAPCRSRAPPAATFPSSCGTGVAAPAVTYIPGRSDARWNATNQTSPERMAAGRRRLRAGRAQGGEDSSSPPSRRRVSASVPSARSCLLGERALNRSDREVSSLPERGRESPGRLQDSRYLLPSRWSRQAGGWRWCGRETESRSPTWQCTEPAGLNKIFTESLEISDSYFFHLKQEALPNPLRGELWGLEEAELYIHKGDFCCLEGRRLRRPSCLVETGVRTQQPEHNRTEIPEASRSDADATPGARSALCGRRRARTHGSGCTGGSRAPRGFRRPSVRSQTPNQPWGLTFKSGGGPEPTPAPAEAGMILPGGLGVAYREAARSPACQHRHRCRLRLGEPSCTPRGKRGPARRGKGPFALPPAQRGPGSSSELGTAS